MSSLRFATRKPSKDSVRRATPYSARKRQTARSPAVTSGATSGEAPVRRREDVSPHKLKHAPASGRGAPSHLVQQMLGHRSLATTSLYTHARPDDSSGQYLGM